MKASVLQIELPEVAYDGSEPVVVRVLVELEGVSEWHDFVVKPFEILDGPVMMVTAERALYDRVGDEHIIVRRINRLVSMAVERGAVHLPQRIAA